MQKMYAALVLVLLTATTSAAQVPDQLPGPTTPPADTALITDHNGRSKHGPAVDRTFWILGAALNTAMVLDTRSTFAAGKRCVDCHEANPFVAPFIRRGPTVTFVAGEAFDVGVMALAGRMRTSDRPLVRRTWWVIPVALIAGHSLAFRHNSGLAR